MNILLLEPYYTGSHAAWTAGYATHSRHPVTVLSMPGRFWKWRMHGGAVTLARRFLAMETTPVFFNSQYHMDSFLDELPRLLKHFPDQNEFDTVEALRFKSEGLALGLDLHRFDAFRPDRQSPNLSSQPLVLWNHRWEYDKNPQEFFEALHTLVARELDFGLIILGERFRKQPTEFIEARQQLGERVRHFGYVLDFADYARWLWQADVLPVASHQDFFGASVVEAIYCGCFPLLPWRLSYPELIPREYHHLCFYQDFDDLVDRLEWAIQNLDRMRQIELQDAVARFDWSVMAPAYDARLESVVSRR